MLNENELLKEQVVSYRRLKRAASRLSSRSIRGIKSIYTAVQRFIYSRSPAEKRWLAAWDIDEDALDQYRFNVRECN